ncbi:MAG: hypothetical protein ACRERE_01430 [Candidatus Entotheonellia bacterium]
MSLPRLLTLHNSVSTISPELPPQKDYVAQLLRVYERATLQALTGYTYLVEAMHALWP